MPKRTGPPSADKMFDLFMLCLMWLREDRPEILRRPAVSVFHLLYQTKVITNAERLAIVGNPKRHLVGDARLISKIMQNSELLKFERTPDKKRVGEICDATDKLLLVLVVPSEALQYHKILGPDGYKIVITRAGMEHARSITQQYEGIMDVQTFKAGWTAIQNRMRGITGVQRSKVGKATSADSQASGHVIPQAPGYEDEW